MAIVLIKSMAISGTYKNIPTKYGLIWYSTSILGS
jgi:hypothetical protein